MTIKIIYLHGFNSSPKSHKAQLLIQYMDRIGKGDDLIVPELSPYPGDAVVQITNLIKTIQQQNDKTTIGFIGSSLGGFYSTWFSEKYKTRAVLINPSVKPYETLALYLGVNENYYTSEKYQFNQSHIQQLIDINVNTITVPERYLVLLQTKDEVLDYHQAEEKYSQTKLEIEQGGDHSFQGFENHIEKIVKFIGM